MKASSKTVKIVTAALFAALPCVATMVIQVPSPMSGYVNLGDGLVLLSGFLLGPVWGGCAAGIGTALADLFSGYGYYAPGTFVIKFFMAFAAALILKKCGEKNKWAGLISGGLLAEVIMVAGYFGYAALLLGKGVGAAASIPGNAIQGVFGIVVALILYPVLSKILNRKTA